MGQGYSGYGDTRSSKVGFPPMSNYDDDGDWASGPKYRSDTQYQEKPGWPSDVGFHDRMDNGGFSGGSFHPGRAPGYSRHDTGAWHQTPGLSSGSGLGSGSRCPQCGTPSYGRADERGSNMRDPFGQAQRRFSRCSNCGYVPTTGPYSQPTGPGPMPPADDFYDQKPFGGSFSNHHSRDDWQQYPGGGFDNQFDNNNNMAFPQPNPPMDTFDHRPQQQWNQGPFSSPDAYDFQDSYPTMDADAYGRGFGRQGFPVGGRSYGFPDMGMSGTSRRRPQTPFPRQNMVASIHYSERVYHRGDPRGMGSRSYGGRYDSGNDMW